MRLMHLTKATVAALALIGWSYSASAAEICEGAELIHPGKLVIAYDGNLPGTGTQDGKITGIDGQILQQIADKLGLEIEPQLMEWSGIVESVRSRRVDVMAGMMGWTQPRVKALQMTDPVYYAGSLITQRKGTGITKLDQLADKKIGSPQGYAWNADLLKINKDIRLYDTQDLAIRDLVAGRVDVLFLDPPSVQYLGIKQPDLNLESIPVTDPFDPEKPSITGKYQIVFGMSLEAPKLGACVNKAIEEIWATCQNAKIAKEYGLSDPYWFTPPEQNPRQGLDRDSGWNFPKLAACQG